MKNEKQWKEIHELFEENAKKASVKYHFNFNKNYNLTVGFKTTIVEIYNFELATN